MSAQHHNVVHCGSCAHCGVDRCPAHNDPTAARGWRLVLPAGLVFLGPIVLAIIGSYLGGPGGGGQFLGGLAGLALGLGTAALYGHRQRTRLTEGANDL